MDGTFQTCPSLFYQIFTLHAFKNGKQFPFVYCLLPGKSRLLYLRALELLILKAGEIGFNLRPTEVVTDFEIAPRTNNYLEGWHNKLKGIARKAHPNLFEIVTLSYHGSLMV